MYDIRAAAVKGFVHDQGQFFFLQKSFYMKFL